MKKKNFFIFLVIIIMLLIVFNQSDRKKEDFYDAVNQDLLKKNHLKGKSYSWSRFTEAQEEVDEDVDSIVLDILNNNESIVSSSLRNNMLIVYDNILDNEERDSVGLGELKRYIDSLFSSQNIEEYIQNGIKIEQELGVNIFNNISVQSDYLNNEKNIIYFNPITLAFGSSAEIFVNDDYMSYKAYIKRAMNQLLKVYGYDKKEASNIVHELVKFYEEIGNHSYDKKYFEDMSHYYHVISFDDFKNLYSNIDITNYLKIRGIYRDEFSVVDEQQIRFLNDNLLNEKLELWKYYGLMQILSNYANYLGSSYVEIVNSLNQAIAFSDEEKSPEKLAREMVSNLFSSDIDRIFSKRTVSDKEQKVIRELFSDIKDAFSKRLKNNTWLSDKTKNKAVAKLKAMKIVIGDDSLESFENISLSHDSLVSNIISFQQELWKKELQRLETGTKTKQISDTIVNAYYNPQDNSVHIPSAFFYLMEDTDIYSLLGSIGMIIAHEVTHGFDGNGSKFDSKGIYRDWWTAKDRDAFLDRQQMVIDYYNQYEVLNGRTINGRATVNENIADLGALEIITAILEKRGATKQEYQTMFFSFAKLWASQEEEHYLKLILLTDSHSPNKYRVNAVLSSNFKFYQVYQIHFWNDMYLSKEKRVVVW